MILIKDRLTTYYKVPGTDTFRLASSKLLDFYGTNLQNPTDSVMRCVIPDDGRVFIQPDQSGAEAFVVAMETRPGRFRALFDNEIKPHSYMALQIFTDKFRGPHPVERYKRVYPAEFAKYPECKEILTTIKNAPNEYHLGKLCIHAFNYDMGPRTFLLNVLTKSEGSIVLTFKQGKEFKNVHKETFPEIYEWHSVIQGTLAATRTLRNLFGYPRLFTRIWDDTLLRQAYSFIPQSTVGTITNIAYTELFYRIRKEHLPWTLLNNKHDSLLIEVPDTTEHVEQAKAYLKEHMGRELISSRGEHYNMKVGISIGHNWGKHSKDNPDGMKEL